MLLVLAALRRPITVVVALVAIALCAALAASRPVFPDGKWGRATLEVCLGILDSSRQQREISLSRQVPSA